MIKFVEFLKKLFSIDHERLQISDVEQGDRIRVEWSRIKGGIGMMNVRNNDPKTKRIFLECKWSDKTDSDLLIWKYNCKELRNFHLLNPELEESIETESKDLDDSDLAGMQKKMNEALDQEDYRLANELQKKIDKLTK